MRKIYFVFLLLLASSFAKAQFPLPYCNVSFPLGVEPITKVQFAGINNSSPAATGGVPLQDFLTVIGTVEQGLSYTITVEGNSDGPYTNFYRVFFDWNKDNDFDDAGEMYEIGSINNSTGVDGKTAFASIAVPASASTGNTRMRVIKKYGTSNPSTLPCNTTGYGEAEDYTINVLVGNVCSGTPNGGTTVASVPYLCSTGTSVITVSSFSGGLGISFAWESSPAGANSWGPVTGGSGDNTNSYTTGTLTASTDFRCKVTCSNGGAFSYSTISTVTVATAAPNNDAVCSAETLTANNPFVCGNSLCATATGDPTFSASTPNNTVWYQFTPSSTGVYNLILKRPTGVTSGLLNAWVGFFTATGSCPTLTLTELTTATANYDLTLNDSVLTVTPSLTAGTTYYLMVDGFAGSAGAFCIRIQQPTTPPPACVMNILPANNATNIPYSNGVLLRWNTVSGATGYDVYFGTTSTPVLLGAVTVDSVRVTGLAGSTQYYWYVAPKNSAGPATTCISNMTTFTTTAPPPPPANNDCSNAIPLSSGVTINATTVDATQSQVAEVCASFTGVADDDVWFSFSTNSTGGAATIALTQPSTGFDAVIIAYSGTCGSLTSIGCADATGSAGLETVNLTGLAPNTTYYFRVYSYSGLATAQGTFSITVSGAALPVSYTSFKAEKRGTENLLSWTTASEQNNAGFEIQRSTNGINFSKILFVASKANSGSSNAALTYAVVDVKPFSGDNYYRLKQVDKDGKSNLSQVVVIRGIKPTKVDIISVYPNPANSVLNMGIASPGSSKVTLLVSDVTGRAVLTTAFNLQTGDNNVQLNVSTLSKGTYTIKVICADGCESSFSKFIKH